MSLPQKVIEKDQSLDYKLSQTADELMELRWHWTKDENNPERVSMREYARQVGRTFSVIQADANGWAEWLAANPDREHVVSKVPGKPHTPNEFRELAKMGAEKRQATEAIAKATGKAISTVATGHSRQEIDAVVNTARERAVSRGTTVEHEIERAAERRESDRRAMEKMKDERKKRSTAAYISIEGDVGAAMQRLRNVLRKADGVDFRDEEMELITDALGKLRALLNLLDMRFTGEVDVNWDAEFEKITK